MDTIACPDPASTHRQRIRLTISGAVQGVGFRPFVCRLATSEKLGGFVRNTSSGLMLEAEGPDEAISRFLARLKSEAKSPAFIDRIEREELPPTGDGVFSIETSSAAGAPHAHVMPDLAMCDECLSEISDPADRRHRYPFTTCTHCGPRYSIIEAVPYDRERTAMRHFPMCSACRAEYDDPASRRFHAETNACPDCGPRLALYSAGREHIAASSDALTHAAAALREGKILALKGLGGFQLMVDAGNERAVARLRQRKHRPEKPFAIMVRSLAEAEALAHLAVPERELLRSAAAPIVLLRRKGSAKAALAPGVTPDNPDIGIMLPCTPLHHLLLDELRFPVIATSGNRSGEPIAASDDEAFDRLAGVADLFLSHDRAILRPVDDSVMRVIHGEATTLRCARGLAPLPLADAAQTGAVLALGGHMKSSAAVAGEGRIVLGPHIGDLDGPAARSAYAQAVESMTGLYGALPGRVACDLHPGYHSSHRARAMGAPVSKVPHHLAHVLAAMIDNDLADVEGGPVLGVAWDGTGYGADGTIRGGEFLHVEGGRYRRAAHFARFRLPGGEAAVREPRRAAIGALHAAIGDALWDNGDLAPLADFARQDREILRAMLARDLNSPLTSSAGRLFDAAAAILGLCQRTSFEGQAAMAVEFAARRAVRTAALPAPEITPGPDAMMLEWKPMIAAIARHVRDGAARDELAAGFIDWLADAIVEAARFMGIERVVLTGGCFQNALLTTWAVERLRAAGFRPFRHRRVPPGDGGLAVGQAAFAARAMQEETGPCALPFPAKS